MMKKQPRFKSETQETEWWAKNQELSRASQAGASPTITIRLAEDDLTRARTFAAEKGLRYQTYLKMLLHQALDSEEKRARRR